MFVTRTKKSKSQKRKSDKESENWDAKLVLELVEPISKRSKTDVRLDWLQRSSVFDWLDSSSCRELQITGTKMTQDERQWLIPSAKLFLTYTLGMRHMKHKLTLKKTGSIVSRLLFQYSRWFRDARAVLEKNILLNKSGSIDDTSGKLYKGQAAYKNYIAKSESQIGMNKYTGFSISISMSLFISDGMY